MGNTTDSHHYLGIVKFDTLKSAFTRVSENAGCRGSDGVTIQMFQRNLEHNLKELGDDLVSGHSWPFPLLRFPVPKRKSEGVRYLSVPTVQDRVAQAVNI